MSLNWNNLTKDERTRYMQIQMSSSTNARSAYLPDDCSECSVCGTPTLGSGWCNDCYKEWRTLRDKLEVKP